MKVCVILWVGLFPQQYHVCSARTSAPIGAVSEHNETVRLYQDKAFEVHVDKAFYQGSPEKLNQQQIEILRERL